MKIITKIAAFSLFLLLSVSASAGVWINDQRVRSDGKVDVDINWSNASGLGQYRIYFDDDSTPFYGGSVIYTGQKPYTIQGLEPCLTYEIAVERKRYHKIWPFKAYYTWPRDTPNASVQTKGQFSTYCGHGANATRTSISLDVDVDSLGFDELRFCIVNGHLFDPGNLATFCDTGWQQVDFAYNPSGNHGGAQRFLNPQGQVQFALSDLHPDCLYRYYIVGMQNGSVKDSFQGQMRTVSSSIFDGFFCMTSGARRAQDVSAQVNFAELKPDIKFDPSTLLPATLLLPKYADLVESYLIEVGKHYRKNPSLRRRHMQYLSVIEKSQREEAEPLQTIENGGNPVWAALMSDQEAFKRWQRELRRYKLDLASYLVANRQQGRADEVLKLTAQ